jgi:sulfite reductase alpha subunit-like flavoprotein
MGQAVMEAIERLAVDHGHMSSAQASAWKRRLVDDRRYLEELWS